MAFLGDLLIRLRAETGDFQSDMGKAAHITEQATRKITRVLGGLGIAFSAVGVARFAQGILNAQDDLSKLSQKLNVSVETLAGYQHAADLAGVSNEALTKGIKSLSTQMFDASTGLLESKRNFAALGIEVKTTDGKLKNADAVMLEVADRFAKMQDGAAKSALAVKLFGKAGLDMIPLLNEGSAAIASMVAEGQRLNPVTAESARQSEIFNDNLSRVGKSAATTAIALLNKLLPAMAAISKEMAKAATMPGGGFWSALITGAQTALTGDDTLKNLQERARLAQQMAAAQQAIEINTKSFGEEDKRTIAAKAQLEILRARMNTAMNYYKVLQQGAKAEAEAEAKAKASKTGTAVIGGGPTGAAAAAWKAQSAQLVKFLDETEAIARAEGLAANEGKAWSEVLEAQTQYLVNAEAAASIRFWDELNHDIPTVAKELDDYNKTAEKTNTIGRELGFTFSSAFEDAILKGMEFRDVLKGIAQDILRIVARKMVTEPIAASISSAIGNLFPGKAGGGSVMGGHSYLVGERGPEIFTAGSSGMITPNNALGGMALTFSPNIYIDSRTDSAAIARTVDGAMRMSEARLIEQLNRGQGGITQAVRRA